MGEHDQYHTGKNRNGTKPRRKRKPKPRFLGRLNRREVQDTFVHGEAVNLESQQQETHHEQHESDKRFFLHIATTSGARRESRSGARCESKDGSGAAEDVSQNGHKKKKHEQEEENFRSTNRRNSHMSETQHHGKYSRNENSNEPEQAVPPKELNC